MMDRGLKFVAEHTWQVKERLWMENLGKNMPFIREDKDIQHMHRCRGAAVVVGAGGSVQKYKHLELLKGYKGTIIATDKMLIPCLKEGISPTIVCSIDGDQSIARFYFHTSDEFKTKCPDVALNAIVHPDVVKMCRNRYWFTTPIDDPFAAHSVTRAIHLMTKKTILSSLGNVGGQAFNLAYFLGADPVILVGLDCGYLPEIPLEQTTYYKSYAELARRRGKKVEMYFTKVRNPHTDNEVVLDMNWSVYQKIFLEHAKRAKCRIVNCSPVSSLFGENITYMPLEETLRKWPE